jgi:ribonuclease HII
MRVSPDLEIEQSLWSAGVLNIAGLDEAGRGAWAGPVAAAAVVLPQRASLVSELSGVRDSKQMTPRQRQHWAGRIYEVAQAWAVGFASAAEIDEHGIVPATRLAMSRALGHLCLAPQQLLIDALRLPKVSLPQQALIKGDVRVLSIAAASVLAKTTRDALMIEMESEFPGYGFARHKGYGTALHRAALDLLGPCPQHRCSFAPLLSLINS